MDDKLRSMVTRNLLKTHERVHLCTDDVTEDEARRAAGPQLSPIVWQIGHTVYYDGVWAQQAGAPYEMPGAYKGLFERGTGGLAQYPRLSELKEAFEATHQAMLKAAAAADFSKPIDSPSYSTVGEMMVTACVHRGYHIGKMTTLRALLGKARLFG